MKPRRLLGQLARRGVILASVPDRSTQREMIRWRAPKGVMDDELKLLISKWRAALLRELHVQARIRREVLRIESEAVALGWSHQQLWGTGSVRPDQYGLAELLHDRSEIVALTLDFISIAARTPSGVINQRFYNRNQVQPWQTAVPAAGASCDASNSTNVAEVRRTVEPARDQHSSAVDHISDRVPNSELWHLYPAFRDRCAFLDIETSGLTNPPSYVTLIGLYDGETLRIFERGKDLNEFPAAIARVPFLVTFNGRGFDIPFLSREFHELVLPRLHWDLCQAFRRLGIKGGLKSVEIQMGLERPSALSGISGTDAPLLWRLHHQGDPDALPVLAAYLAEDVTALRPLAERAYNAFAARLLLPLAKLQETGRPVNPVAYDQKALSRLLARMGVSGLLS